MNYLFALVLLAVDFDLRLAWPIAVKLMDGEHQLSKLYSADFTRIKEMSILLQEFLLCLDP